MKFKNFLVKNWLLLVLVIVIFLRLPSLFEPFTYGDEGIYLTLGQAARKGIVWYKEIHDNKPPMLYLMAALAGNFRTYRLIHLSWSLITIFAFWQLVKLVFPKNKPAEILATACFGILSSLHTFEGNVANAENFMMLPTIVGFYLVFENLQAKNFLKSNRNQKILFWLLPGFLFSLATLFKVPAGFDFAAALIFIFLVYWGKENKGAKLKALFIHCGLILTGFILPIIVTFIYYAAKGALADYFVAAFGQNLPYLSSWSQSSSQAGGLPLLMIGRLGLIIILIGLLLRLRKKLTPSIILVLTWFGFAWFAALLSSRPYPHYLIQLLPAFCLSAGFLFIRSKPALFTLRKRKVFKEALIPIILAIIFRLTFAFFHFWQYPNLEYYSNFYQFFLGLKTYQKYQQDFDPKSQTLQDVARYLKKRTSKTEKIFIWGTEPSLYALSERSPVGRYTASYHIVDFDGYQETVEALKRERPRYLLVTGDERRPFPELDGLILNHYILDKQIDQIKIYHRLFQSQ